MQSNGIRLVHQALLYQTEGEFVRTVVSYLREGLANGDRVVAVTTQAKLAAIKDALDGEASYVEFLDIQAFRDTPARRLAALHTYLREPRRVRVMGEPSWVGSDRERREWTRFESLVNVVFASVDANVLCPYDASRLDPRILDAAVKTHPLLGCGEQWGVSGGYVDPVEFGGARDDAPLPEPEGATETLAFRGGHDLRGIRGFLRAHAARAGLAGNEIDTLLVAANEIATNALRHGGGQGTVRCWLEPGRLVCEVTDPIGRITDPFAGYLPPEPDQYGGRGLWLVRQLCDVVEIRSGQHGTVVRLHVRTT